MVPGDLNESKVRSLHSVVNTPRWRRWDGPPNRALALLTWLIGGGADSRAKQSDVLSIELYEIKS